MDKPFYKNYSFWNLIILIFTLIVLGIYTYDTNKIKKESILSNKLSQRPFITIVMHEKQPVEFVNEGNGPALNVTFLRKSFDDNKLFMLKEEDVGVVLGKNKRGSFDNINDVEEVKLAHIKEKLPFAYKLIEEWNKNDYNWLCFLYEDIYGSKFATFTKGVGGGYDSAVIFTEF